MTPSVCLQRLAQDWQRAYGHSVLVAESFVDGQLFRGTSYQASGWTLLGQTKGFARARQDYYVAHERPKQLWARELRPGARAILRGRNLPGALQGAERGQVPECVHSAQELEGMNGFFAGLPDWGELCTGSPVCHKRCIVAKGCRDGGDLNPPVSF